MDHYPNRPTQMTLRGGHYILVGQSPVIEPDALKWARWFETADRKVALTEVGPHTISTVFLGLDHNFMGKGPPLLFETMVFSDGEATDYMTRSSSWLEAEGQHHKAVAFYRQRKVKRK